MRCKKVKNKPKVNQELSILEYKKKLGEMERKLATQNAQIVALEQALRVPITFKVSIKFYTIMQRR